MQRCDLVEYEEENEMLGSFGEKWFEHERTAMAICICSSDG